MTEFEDLFKEPAQEELKHDKKKKVGGYILGHVLGEGSFAKVRLGTHLLTKHKVGIQCRLKL